jgi:hypothetical protein
MVTATYHQSVYPISTKRHIGKRYVKMAQHGIEDGIVALCVQKTNKIVVGIEEIYYICNR